MVVSWQKKHYSLQGYSRVRYSSVFFTLVLTVCWMVSTNLSPVTTTRHRFYVITNKVCWNTGVKTIIPALCIHAALKEAVHRRVDANGAFPFIDLCLIQNKTSLPGNSVGGFVCQPSSYNFLKTGSQRMELQAKCWYSVIEQNLKALPHGTFCKQVKDSLLSQHE